MKRLRRLIGLKTTDDVAGVESDATNGRLAVKKTRSHDLKLADGESLGHDDKFAMPDIYDNNYEATVPDLNIIDQAEHEIDNSSGFNPYDTAVLHQKFAPKRPK